METEPWKDKGYVQEGDNYPAVYISWNHAKEFCNKVGLDLPTEAEWEYACRAKTTTRYYWGNQIDGKYCWYSKNSSKLNHVGEKKNNAFGLYDMSGNVWEWCEDRYGRYKPDSIVNLSTSPGVYRVLRGGSYFDGAVDIRSANRSGLEPDDHYVNSGFRPALNLKAIRKTGEL